MSWQALLVVSIFTEVIGRLFQRTLLKDDKSDPTAYAIVQLIAAGIILGVYALIKGFELPPNLPQLLPNLIAMPVLIGLTNIFVFRSLKITEASIFTILFSTRVIFLIIGAILVFGESFSPQQIVGTILILLSVILVSWKKQHFAIQKGEVFAILASVIFAAVILNDSYVVQSFDVTSYMPLIFLLPGLFLWIVNPKITKRVIDIVRKPIALKIAFVGCMYAVSATTYLTAYQIGSNAAQIASLYQVSSILTVLLAVFLLQEKTGVLMKILAGILSFIGVLLVA